MGREVNKDFNKLKFKVNLKNLPENRRKSDETAFRADVKNKGRDESKQVDRTKRQAGSTLSLIHI